MMPPTRKIVVDEITAVVAVADRISPSRVNRNAITTVANTSKKPSTHRWTTHQRQYSVIDRCVSRPMPNAAPKKDAIARQLPSSMMISERCEPDASGAASVGASAPPRARTIAGHMARAIRKNQMNRPANSAICQKRPRSRYSMPVVPNHQFVTVPWPILPVIESHSPIIEPSTTTTSATNRTFTPSRWNRGSRPPTAGATYRPVASQAVAIHRMPSWVCHVRTTAYGRNVSIWMPYSAPPSTP